MASTKIALQREIFYDAFEKLGGIDRLLIWCNESSDNYKEFIKLYVKLVPPIKTNDKGDIESHESFVKMIMEEEKKRISQLGEPVKLIDAIENQSQ